MPPEELEQSDQSTAVSSHLSLAMSQAAAKKEGQLRILREEAEKRQAAAVKIQAQARARAGRKAANARVKARNTRNRKAEGALRGAQGSEGGVLKRAKDNEEEDAAIKIQSMARGRAGRNRVKKLKPSQVSRFQCLSAPPIVRI